MNTLGWLRLLVGAVSRESVSDELPKESVDAVRLPGVTTTEAGFAVVVVVVVVVVAAEVVGVALVVTVTVGVVSVAGEVAGAIVVVGLTLVGVPKFRGTALACSWKLP